MELIEQLKRNFLVSGVLLFFAGASSYYAILELLNIRMVLEQEYWFLALPVDVKAQGTVGAVTSFQVPETNAPIWVTVDGYASVDAENGGNLTVILEVNGEECGRSFAYRNPGTPANLFAQATCFIKLTPGAVQTFEIKTDNTNAIGKEASVHVFRTFSKSAR